MNNQKKAILTIFPILLIVTLFGCVEYEPDFQEPTPTPTPISTESITGYDRVLSIDGNGTVIYGSWDDTYDRIINNLENCILNFDNRIAKPKYIEYANGMIRFDFQSLDAIHDTWDAYAFVQIELNVKAGLGSNYRRGHDDYIWMTSNVQNADVVWNPCTVDIYCEPERQFTLAASFNSAGGVVQGSWEDMYETIVTHGADCKIKFDNRIMIPPHIEYGDDWFNFDALGLQAHHDGTDSYAYAHVTSGSRAGIGTTYRRGTGTEIIKKDRDQYAEYEWRGMGIEVYCNDIYEEEYIFNSSGNIINNDEKSWQDLLTMIVYEARDCTVIYDNRISKPCYIEYSNNFLQFDFANLHSWHPGSDYYESFALLYLEYNNTASLRSCYRRAYAPIIFQKTTAQHSIANTMNIPIRIRCAKGDGYSRALTIDGNGNAASGSVDELFSLLSSGNNAFNIKLRQDNRITMPEIIEYGDSATDPIYFEYQSLGAYHNSWDCFALTLVQKDNTTGLTGSYRRGHADNVWQRTLLQHAVYTPIFQTDVDIFLKTKY